MSLKTRECILANGMHLSIVSRPVVIDLLSPQEIQAVSAQPGRELHRERRCEGELFRSAASCAACCEAPWHGCLVRESGGDRF